MYQNYAIKIKFYHFKASICQNSNFLNIKYIIALSFR